MEQAAVPKLKARNAVNNGFRLCNEEPPESPWHTAARENANNLYVEA